MSIWRELMIYGQMDIAWENCRLGPDLKHWWLIGPLWLTHYCDVIMGAVTSQITSLTIVYSTVYSDTDQRKHQSSVSLAFVRGIHRGPVNSPHKWAVTRKKFPFDDVIMQQRDQNAVARD